MGELIGLPEWLAQTFFVITLVAISFGVGARNTQRQINQLKKNRPNPDRAQFLTMMQPDVSDGTSQFLWDTAMFYLDSRGLTPHPDDLLLDLPIDEDDWSMDWPRDFAGLQGFHESDLPDWPKDWPATIRNYGRWLDMGLPQDQVSGRPPADDRF